jgi:hypothetical protein
MSIIPKSQKSLIIALLMVPLLHMILPATVLAQTPPTVEVFIAEFTNHELRQRMERNAGALLTEINAAFIEQRDLRLSAANISAEYHAALNEMWKTARFYVPDDRIIEVASTLTSGYHEMRNIPLFFSKPDDDEHYEEAVMQFSAAGIISEFRIGLPSHRYQQLMRQGEDQIDSANRQRILSFTENFRTAYNRKDIDYINTVFSDQALIIVGRVVQSTGTRSAYEQQVEYLQFTKDEYIERLRNIFRSNTWIDVGFEDIRILRHPRLQHMYGVNLTQYYNSSIYSDVGYLFLLIDFRKPEEPVIHVRTWQPRSATPESQVFTLGDMEIF